MKTTTIVTIEAESFREFVDLTNATCAGGAITRTRLPHDLTATSTIVKVIFKISKFRALVSFLKNRNVVSLETATDPTAQVKTGEVYQMNLITGTVSEFDKSPMNIA